MPSPLTEQGKNHVGIVAGYQLGAAFYSHIDALGVSDRQVRTPDSRIFANSSGEAIRNLSPNMQTQYA